MPQTADGRYTFNHPTYGPITGLTLSGYQQMVAEVYGNISPKRADEDWFVFHERVAAQEAELVSNAEWLVKMGHAPDYETAYAMAVTTAETAETARLAEEEEAAETARLAEEEARLAAEEEARLAAEEAQATQQEAAQQEAAQQEAQQQAAAAQAAREAAAKEARGKVMSIDQRWIGPLEDGSYWQNPNHQDYDPAVLTPGASTGTDTGTGTDTNTGLFGYYRDALNLVSDDGGLAALATPAETAFRSEGNPFASNTASNTTGNVPNYTYERAQVPGTYDANRRPGSRGQRYFSDAAFVPQGSPQRQAVRNRYANQASDAQLVNRANMAQQRQFEAQPRPTYTAPTNTPLKFSAYTPPVNPVSEAGTSNPAPTENDLIAFLAQQQEKKKDSFIWDNDIAKAKEEEGGSPGNLPEEATGGPHPHPNMRAGGLARLAAGGAASAYNRRYNGYEEGGSIKKGIGAWIKKQLEKKKEEERRQKEPFTLEKWKDKSASQIKDLFDSESNERWRARSRRQLENLLRGEEEVRTRGGIDEIAAGGAIDGMAYRTPQTQGYYVGGATDGMADRIPARIDNNQEARLSDGEFVVPADVVSHLGNGNSSAGAKNLYGMMDRVRQARTGNKQQGRQIDPNKFIPNR